MTWHTGRLLLAGPYLHDPNFFRSVVLLVEHHPDGALGVVLNRPTDLAVHEALPAWGQLAAPPAVVFAGGPVSPETGLALGHSPGVAPLVGDVGLVDLEDAPAEGRVRIFAGYAGWSPGQLEGELAEDAWLVLDAEPDDVLGPEPAELWSTVLARQPGRLSLLARYPDEPAFN